ncbi:hypothetical protein [Nostoc parmelioides]|uniref:Uncharacterized protein n=1 Tax=Nostoc parmelioides FACHB-3921 TaxID=2692909 RepID=A0ABR8BHZ8_9NOSO|nr:hypothetical protein [Nostoc parmelioides]MBD2253742.1 hypothetical protein [Nostoc parmelioides FACHB-3921]
MKFLENIFKILITVTLINYMRLPVALADVITPGESRVNYCFKITNPDKYPNYLLIAHIKSQNPNLPTYNRILQSGKCLGLNGYREYSDIYAIKKSLLKSQEIVKSEEGESIKDLNSKKSLLIPANNSITSLRLLPDIYGIKEVADVLEIVEIAPTSLDLKYKAVVYTSQLGTSETKAYQVQDTRPLPSLLNHLNLLKLIISAISLAGIIMVYKKLKFDKKHS